MIISPLHTHSFFLHLSSFSLSFCNKERFKTNIYIYSYIHVSIYVSLKIWWFFKLVIFSNNTSKIRNWAFCCWSWCLKIINESHWLQVFIKISKLSNGAPVIIRVSSKMSTVAVPRQHKMYLRSSSSNKEE